jgi:calcineurin-like phosphoesterase family protein
VTNTFFTSDIHFGHKNILEYEKEHRPFRNVDEMNRTIIERWNTVVQPEDAVWILGDLVINKGALENMRLLNGRKRLVMGNHDVFKEGVLEPYVDRLFGCVQKKLGNFKVIMTHIPVHTSQVENRFAFNLHGHLHSDYVKLPNKHPDLRYINLSMEHWNMTPVSFHDLNAEAERRAKLLGIKETSQ